MKIGSAFTQQTLFGQTATTGLIRGQLALDAKAVDGFAEELTRRAEQGAKPQAAQTVDAKGLTKAVTGAVNSIKDSLGDNAARAVMGIVMGGVGDGGLTEESLGDGFVKALQFIDNTFGTKAGDQAIGVFNGQLNDALNGYFQNGSNESFLAVDLDTAMSQAASAMAETVGQFLRKTQKNTADAGSSLLDQADKDRREREAEDQARLDAKGQAKADAQARERAQVAPADTANVTDEVQAAVQIGQARAERNQTGADAATVAGDAGARTSADAGADGQAVDAAAGTNGRAVQADAGGVSGPDAAPAAPVVSMARVRRMTKSASSLRGYSRTAISSGVVVQATA